MIAAPSILGSARELLDRAMAIYRARVAFARGHRSGLWREGLTWEDLWDLGGVIKQ